MASLYESYISSNLGSQAESSEYVCQGIYPRKTFALTSVEFFMGWAESGTGPIAGRSVDVYVVTPLVSDWFVSWTQWVPTLNCTDVPGGAVASVSFSADGITTVPAWTGAVFSSPAVLNSGVLYGLIIGEPSNTSYGLMLGYANAYNPINTTAHYFYTSDAAATTPQWQSATNAYGMLSYRAYGIAGIPPATGTGAYPGGKVRTNKLVAVGGDRVYFEMGAGSLAEITAARDDIDVSVSLDLVPAYEKVFVVNGLNMKVIDTGNSRLAASDIGSHPPDFNTILTGGTSSAQMLVDYITDDTPNNSAFIYGKVITTVDFSDGETVTGTDDDGNAISFTAVSALAQSSVPLWYDWTVWGGDSAYGTLPEQPTIGCLYRGRIVLAGKAYDSHQWEMSRQGNPWDWNYVANDAQAPIAGNNADVGKVGEPIIALIPRKDDYLIFGCTNSLWVLRGDPAEGGSLDPITLTTGMFGPKSWCWDAEDNLYFWGSGGIYLLPTQGGTIGQVVNLTAQIVPDIIGDEKIDPSTHRVTMGYDRRRHGILISITRITSGANSNYWLDLRTKGLFPESYPTNAAVESMCFYNADDDDYRHLLLGCKDGYIRYFDDNAKVDDNGDTDAAISAYCVFGPYALNEDPDNEGKLISSTIVVAGGASGGAHGDADGVALEYFVGDDAETVIEDIKDGATAFLSVAVTGTGRKTKLRTKVRGNFCAIKCSTIASSQTWSIEKFVGQVKPTRGETE